MSEKIGKADLIDKVSESTGYAKKEVAEVTDAIINTIGTVLQAGDKVTIPGFGSFKVSKTKERNGVNPQTHEPIKIPATNRISFTAGKPLKELVNTKSKKKTKVDLTKKVSLKKKK